MTPGDDCADTLTNSRSAKPDRTRAGTAPVRRAPRRWRTGLIFGALRVAPRRQPVGQRSACGEEGLGVVYRGGDHLPVAQDLALAFGRDLLHRLAPSLRRNRVS